MRSVLLVFANLCLLRRGPELVPTQPWFVIAVVHADLLTSYLVFIQIGASMAPLPLTTSLFVTTATTAAIGWMALHLRGFENRFAATIVAIFGCDLFFTVVIAIVATAAPGFSDAVFRALVVMVALWGILVNGFILHRAMEVSRLIGTLIAFGIAVFGSVTSSIAVGSSAT